jgi:tetratricopeptide (TPR) repeat protein
MEHIFDEESGQITRTFRDGSKTERGVLGLDYAEELKGQGNNAFKSARFAEAATCYAKALLALEDFEGPPPSLETEAGVVAAEQKLTCGQRVAIRLKQESEIEVEGIICCDNEDGTYDIILEDSSDRDAVPHAQIRSLPPCGEEGGSAKDAEAARRRTLACACLVNGARCAFQTEQYGISVALATRAIELNPTNPVAFFVRGRARLAIPYLDLAKQDLMQACQVESQNAEYRKALAEVKEKIRVRNQNNRETAALMLSYMRAEGVTSAAAAAGGRPGGNR